MKKSRICRIDPELEMRIKKKQIQMSDLGMNISFTQASRMIARDMSKMKTTKKNFKWSLT